MLNTELNSAILFDSVFLKKKKCKLYQILEFLKTVMRFLILTVVFIAVVLLHITPFSLKLFYE